MRKMVDKLIDTKDPFYFNSERDKLFAQAMKEAFYHHYENCKLYQKLCYFEGFTPKDFKEYCDVFEIPHLFVMVLKNRRLVSVPEEEVKLVLTSSGTGGKKSEVCLDSITLQRIKKIVWNIYESYGMANKDEIVNCILFSYEYDYAKNVGTAFSDQLLSGLTKVKERTFALKYDSKKGDFYLDTDGVIDALIRYNEEGLPLRIIGFPAFLYELWQEYKKRLLPSLNFGKRSFVITGGGWKTKADREIPKSQFKKIIGDWLGMPPENVRDLYGLVEHGVPYCECEAGNLHVPIYSRVVVRDPETMQILPVGEVGLFHLYTPYMNSFPAISLLTTDVGILGEKCACGRNSPYIVILGRGGRIKHKGCAIQALDYLQ